MNNSPIVSHKVRKVAELHENDISNIVLDRSIKIHSELGPGLFESGERLINLHKKQVLTYLRLPKTMLGLLINLNEKLIKNGFIRIVNKLEDKK